MGLTFSPIADDGALRAGPGEMKAAVEKQTKTAAINHHFRVKTASAEQADFNVEGNHQLLQLTFFHFRKYWYPLVVNFKDTDGP